MTPVADLVARIPARVLDKQQAPDIGIPISPDDAADREADDALGEFFREPQSSGVLKTPCSLLSNIEQPPVPEDPDLARQAEAWAEPEPGE